MIVVDKVSKEFTKKDEKNKKIKFLADNDISFEAHDGEILGVLGPNGAGKTTLLRMLSGSMAPTSGNITIDDMSYDKNAVDIKRKIAFLSGSTKLYKDISPKELLVMCGDLYGVPKDVAKKKIEETIKTFDMSSFQNQKIGSLSTGQYQRTCIARCIIHDPKYYIFDEVTSGLDIISAKVILDFIKEEKKLGKCFIYSTHYMEEAQNICDKVVLIHKGEIIKKGTPSEIIEETGTTNLRDAFFALIKEVEE